MKDKARMWKNCKRLLLLAVVVITLFMPVMSAKASSAVRLNATTKELTVGKS